MEKNFERRIIKSFLSVILPGARPKLKATEKPDFELHLSSKKIGIEVTEYHHDVGETGGSKTRKEDARIRRLNQKLKEYAGINTDRKIKCNLEMLPDSLDEDWFLEHLLRCLENLLKNPSVTPDYTEKLWVSYNPGRLDLPKEIQGLLSSVIVYLSTYHTPGVELCISGGWYGFGPDTFFNYITRKNEKASHYMKEGFDELWLIISGNSISRGTVWPRSIWLLIKGPEFDCLRIAIENSRFSRVFLHDFRRTRIIEYDKTLRRWKKLEGQEVEYERLYTLDECCREFGLDIATVRRYESSGWLHPWDGLYRDVELLKVVELIGKYDEWKRYLGNSLSNPGLSQ